MNHLSITANIHLFFHQFLRVVLVIFLFPSFAVGIQRESNTTNLLISYFDNLVSKNIIVVDHLKHIHEHEELVNPLTEAEALTSSTHYVYWKQLDGFIKQLKSHGCLDNNDIKIWAERKIAELENQASTRELIHEKTANTHYPLSFVSLPEGTYKSQLDQKEFVIELGVEIQETPVTQYQWASVMGNNLAHFSDGSESQEIVIKGNKIKMRANWPVESISYAQVREFINKLNEHDADYIYDLPSLQEYEALLQAALGQDWPSRLLQHTPAENIHDVKLGPYGELHQQRIWNIFGNVWQFTRDRVMLNENTQGFLVFGGSYTTKRDTASFHNELIRPVLNGEYSVGNTLGFRLVRYKRDTSEKEAKVYDGIVWHKHADHHQNWQWHRNDVFEGPLFYNDIIEFIRENRQYYSDAIQHTVDSLYISSKPSYVFLISLQNKKIQNLTPLSCFIKLKGLELGRNQIRDVSPLSTLTSLKELNLSNNEIENVNPIGRLSNLQKLFLKANKIRNIGALTDLRHIERLDLTDNEIEDIQGIEKLTNLRELVIQENKLNNIEPLSSLIHLKYLYLDDNQITTIEPLENLASLEWLSLGHNPIRSIKALPSLKLRMLDLHNTFLKEINFLKKLTNLTNLNLNNNMIADVKPLKNLTMLDKPSLGRNKIKDITPLKNLTNLRTLYLSHNQIRDVTALENLKHLVELSLDGNPLEDITPLKQLANLEDIYLDKDQIEKFNAHEFFKNSNPALVVHEVEEI